MAKTTTRSANLALGLISRACVWNHPAKTAVIWVIRGEKPIRTSIDRFFIPRAIKVWRLF